jgi:hypothetical protein
MIRIKGVIMTIVATLGSKGWVSETIDKVDIVLSHFFLSDYNQTQLYIGTIKSLKHIIQKNGGLLEPTSNEIGLALNELLSKYFDTVDVSVVYNDDEDDARVRLDVQINISIYDDNEYSTNITKFVSIENSIIKKIINMNN